MASIQTQYRTSLRSEVILLTNCRAQPGLRQNAPLNWCDGTARLIVSLKQVSFQTEAKMLRLYRLIATMDAAAPLPALTDQEPTWASASALARGWGLNQLADRLAEKADRCGQECCGLWIPVSRRRGGNGRGAQMAVVSRGFNQR